MTGFVTLTVNDNGDIRGERVMLSTWTLDLVIVRQSTAAGSTCIAGSGCDDADAQGGHLFQGEDDPWTTTAYPSTDGNGRGFFELDVQIDRTDVEGKTFVIHSSDGGALLVASSSRRADG